MPIMLADSNKPASELIPIIRNKLSNIAAKVIWYSQHKETPLPLSLVIQNECRDLHALGVTNDKLKKLGFIYAAQNNIGSLIQKYGGAK